MPSRKNNPDKHGFANKLPTADDSRPLVRPSLVQRVIRRDRPEMTGIDKFFEFDFMGSAEFEFGALGKALKQMRESYADNPQLWSVEIIRFSAPKAGVDKTCEIFFVGPRSMLIDAAALFTDQLLPIQSRVGHTKELTFIRDTYFPESAKFPKQVSAWWALDSAFPFVLCRKCENAKLWLDAMKG